jgi:predicted transcriptional regulator
MKYSSIIFLFLLVGALTITTTHADYSVEPYSPPIGPFDTLGADDTVSFFDLPLWIQLTWTVSIILAFFGAIKFGPFVIGKIKTLLHNRNCIVILHYIRTNPGCTIAELSKCTGINRGTAKYHLYLLYNERKVILRKEGKITFLFSNSSDLLGKNLIYGYLRYPTKKEILTIILNRPGINNKEIAEMLHLEKSSVYWHLKQLLKENIISRRWDGRNMRYSLHPEVEDIVRNTCVKSNIDCRNNIS